MSSVLFLNYLRFRDKMYDSFCSFLGLFVPRIISGIYLMGMVHIMIL